MDFCANPSCHKPLPADIRQKRHRTQDDNRPLFCDRDCKDEWQTVTGLAKHYSEMGKAGRIAFLQRVRPRRPKKGELPR